MFEGEYLNGNKNGKGKEYYIGGILKFEGEYLNGDQWNGNGYHIKNKKVYDLINGKGFVREFNNYGRRIFKGDYLNGKRNGKGKEIKYGKLIFEGEYLNGKKRKRKRIL